MFYLREVFDSVQYLKSRLDEIAVKVDKIDTIASFR